MKRLLLSFKTQVLYVTNVNMSKSQSRNMAGHIKKWNLIFSVSKARIEMLKFRPVQHKPRKKKTFYAIYAYFLQTFGAIAKGYKYSNRHYAYRNFRYREFQTFYLSSLYFFWRIPSSTLVWRAGSPTAHSSGTDRYISAILEDAPPEMLSSLWIMNHTILAKIDRTRASLELKSARITSRVLFPVLFQLPQFRFLASAFKTYSLTNLKTKVPTHHILIAGNVKNETTFFQLQSYFIMRPL